MKVNMEAHVRRRMLTQHMLFLLYSDKDSTSLSPFAPTNENSVNMYVQRRADSNNHRHGGTADALFGA
jgi:hypothetical protein